MSNLTNDQLLDLVETTLSWGSEVAEKWSGTLYQEQIDARKKIIRQALNENDNKKVFNLVSDLALFIEDTEREYNNEREGKNEQSKI